MPHEHNVEGNSSFSEGVQVVWDTVSGDALKKCPQYYKYTIRDGWTRKGTNPHLLFGLVTHSAFETYEKSKIAGLSHDEALREALRYALAETGSRKDVAKCLNKRCGATRPLIVEMPTEQVICHVCGGGAFRNTKNCFLPWESDNPNKNRENLVRTIIWYLDNYKDSSERTLILEDGSPAVEVWFRIELPIKTPSGKSYVLSGHIDKIIEYAGGKWFRDLKTTKSTISSDFFTKFSPNNQMSQYTLAGKVVFDEPLMGGIIDAAQVAVTFSKFQRGFVERTKAQMDEWLHDMQFWIKLAEKYVEADHWPKNDNACHNYGGCDFRDICNKDPSLRDQFLRTYFERRPWNPLEERK